MPAPGLLCFVLVRSQCPLMGCARLIKATVFIFVTGDITLQYYGPYAY
jgi:hypothetical protein